MAPTTQQNGQIVQRKAEPVKTLQGLLESLKGEMAKALPKHMTADRMARVSLTAVRMTKGLGDCTHASFAACIMTLSQLGLEPSNGLGHAYIIPFKNSRAGTTEATLIIGYQGMIELARRSGQVENIWAYPVYEGDDFEVTYGLAPDVKHAPRFLTNDPKKLIAVYAAATLKGSTKPVFVVLQKVEIEAFRKRGASGKNIKTPWDTDYQAMALKTAVRQLFKWLPKSVEMATAAVIDESPRVMPSFEIMPALAAQGFDAKEDFGEGESEPEEAPYDPDTGEVPADQEPKS
jgi:recombination protein RecT